MQAKTYLIIFNIFPDLIFLRATRSFSDEFGGAITGDLLLVQISYAVVFIFLGGTFVSIFRVTVLSMGLNFSIFTTL